MAKKRKLVKRTWAIRTDSDGCYHASYLHKGNRPMTFGTRLAARDHLQELDSWLRNLSKVVPAELREL